jgi:hypothetical protein
MQLKNSCNNTMVFNHPLVGKQNALTDFLLAQKKMAEMEPLGLVVMECNASIGPQDQKEVPLPCNIFFIFFFQITELCSHPSSRFLRLLMRAYWSFALPSRRTTITPTGPTPSSSRSHIDWKTLLFLKIRRNSISIMKDQISFISSYSILFFKFHTKILT